MSKLKIVYEYIKSDFVRYGKNPKFLSILGAVLFGNNHCFKFSFWWRLSSQSNPFNLLAKIQTRRYRRKYGLQIPKEVKIGYGLYIGHGIGIVMNKTTEIGNNCNISHHTTIGANEGKAAIIGDNVYIGPSVCLVEAITIGDNVTIGAGSVVVKDIPENVTIAGVPAKIISYKVPGRYILNKYDINKKL